MIYLDQAATSWPKPQSVIDSMIECLKHTGGNPGRGGYALALETSRKVLQARENISEFFNVGNASHVIFTSNCTEAINMVMWGGLWENDHIILSSLEHNAVARIAETLRLRELEVTTVSCDITEGVIEDAIIEAIRPNTKMIIWTHASNVFGTLFDIKKIGEIAKTFGVSFMVDAAQTAGVFPIDMEECNIDYLAVAGHKGLYGPQGIGLLLIRRELPLLEPWRSGGTGSFSEELGMPEVLPDRLEAGTLNTPGIVGLSAAIEYIKKRGLKSIQDHELGLIRHLHQELLRLPEVTVYGPEYGDLRAPVLSFNIGYLDSNWVAHQLARRWEIAVRSGLHCSPLAHRSAGTLETGTVRVSVGIFNTMEEIQTLIDAVTELSKSI